MDTILQILQTTGICIGSLALVVIAFVLISIWFTFFPSLPAEEGEETEERDIQFKRKKRSSKSTRDSSFVEYF